ncbi:formylglycine-generating enzyme family protein [Oxynema aestuarii]|nr:formylglycine-generating enzyme family protein [Oxynema aestuarii]
MAAANSLVAENSISESAKKIVDRFVSRFDESYRLLVYHAAIPLIVTPELLNYLRHQFLRGQVPWVAQVDLLLSDLFTPVASELYAMDSAVRGYLLGNIDVFFQERGFGEGHLQKVALILLSYIKYLARTHSFLRASELQAQQWAAMVCLEDGKQQVVRELEDAFAKCMSQTELARLTRIILELSPQLGQYPTLIQFAKSVRDWWFEGSHPSESTERVREIARLGQSLGINSSIFLPQFEFETVTVNRRGEIIKRKRHRAAYFTERIPLVFDRGNPEMNESSSTEQQGESELAVPLEMVAIPGGTFMMGSPETEGGSYDDERPQHEVTVQPFFMGKYPVTQAQWSAIATRTDLKVERDLDLNPAGFKDFEDSQERPVERVNWYDAVEFCRRLSKLTGREYRLPSEAEWEYACRAGTTTPFYFGETITGELANYCASTTYAEEPKGQFREQTTPVGQFPPNAFGLYDLHGNVWEWCADSWHRNYEGAPRDGSAWVSDNDNRYPLRGGSWSFNPLFCRSAYRDDVIIIARGGINDDSGFRLACGSGRLPQFEFETVTVNRRGEIIKRERHRAAYFTERIALVFDRGIPEMNESSSTEQQGESELAVPLEMVAIPGGTFMMGSPDGEGYDRETPQHEVTVPPFFMGKYPVTQAQWRAIAARTDLKVERDLDLNPARFKDREDSDERPVEQVSWYDAVEFCGRLSKLTGKEYRLPSEAEWEYACRAGTTTPFYFGETMTGELANYCASTTYAEEPKGQFREQTTPVGQFPPNAFGLYDLHGNVWEWCADSWHRNYEGAPRDGSAWVGDNHDNRSPLRGGSWYNDPHNCYSTYRDGYIVARDDIDVNFGFRVACGSGRVL